MKFLRAGILLGVVMFVGGCESASDKSEASTPCAPPFVRQVQQAVHDPQLKSIARSAVAEMGIPRSAEELKKAGGMAVIGIRAFAKDPKEMPINDAFFAMASNPAQRTVLAPIVVEAALAPVKVVDPAVKAKLGQSRHDAYFLIPVKLLHQAGYVFVRFGKRTRELPVIRTPLKESAHLPKDIEVNQPDDGVIFGLLQRHFCWSKVKPQNK